MSEHARRARAEQARRLLEDPLLCRAFAEIAEQCRRRWLASRPEEAEERERLYHTARLLERLRAELEAVLLDGAMTEGSDR